MKKELDGFRDDVGSFVEMVVLVAEERWSIDVVETCLEEVVFRDELDDLGVELCFLVDLVDSAIHFSTAGATVD